MESIPNKNPLAVLEDEKIRHEEKCKRMEKEMQEVFNIKLELKLKKIQKMQQVLEEEVDGKKSELKDMKVKLLLQKEEFEKERESSISSFVNKSSPTHSNKSFMSLKLETSKKNIMYNIIEQMKIK